MTPAAATLTIIIHELEQAHHDLGRASVRAPSTTNTYRSQALAAHKRLVAFLKTVSLEDIESL